MIATDQLISFFNSKLQKWHLSLYILYHLLALEQLLDAAKCLMFHLDLWHRNDLGVENPPKKEKHTTEKSWEMVSFRGPKC